MDNGTYTHMPSGLLSSSVRRSKKDAFKCPACRKSKKKCLPENRHESVPCDRCKKIEEPCLPSRFKERKENPQQRLPESKPAHQNIQFESDHNIHVLQHKQRRLVAKVHQGPHHTTLDIPSSQRGLIARPYTMLDRDLLPCCAPFSELVNHQNHKERTRKALLYLSLRTIVKMAVEELIALADEVARPFINDPRFSAPRKCMPQLDLVVNDFQSFDRKLKSEISELNKGDIFEALYNAQCDLTNDIYQQKVTWPSSDETIERMNAAIISWWSRKHVGVACVLQMKLFLACPAVAMTQSVDFVKRRTQFMNDLSPLLWELGDKVPKNFQPGNYQLFLPPQLAQIPAITAHFIQCELPDSLGRTINHILIDAGHPIDWQPENINRHDILGRTALYFACRDNDAINAEQLLFANARVDICASNGLLPLHVAAIAGATSICEKICEIRENVTSARYDTDIRDGFGRSAFFWAVSFNHKETATFFSSRIPSTSLSQDAHGFTAISVAASQGHEDMLENLAKNGFPSDEPDLMGRSPLWYASRINSPNIMRFLDDQGAVVDRKDINGMAPLHIAAQTGSTAALEYLLSFNHHDKRWPGVYHWRVDLKAANNWNQSPLVLAAAAQHSSCVKQLAKHGRHALGEANVTQAAAISQQNGDTESFKTLVGLLNAFELITLTREPALPFAQEAESTWQSNSFKMLS